MGLIEECQGTIFSGHISDSSHAYKLSESIKTLIKTTILIDKITQPKMGFNLLSGMNRVTHVPANMPSIANAEKIERKTKFNDLKS